MARPRLTPKRPNAPPAARGRGWVSDLTDRDWIALVDDIDAVLARHGVIGAVAHVYSLYDALEAERDRAIRRSKNLGRVPQDRAD